MYLFLIVSLAKDFSVLFIFSINQLSILWRFCYFVFTFSFIYFYFTPCYFSPFAFSFSPVSSFLSCWNASLHSLFKIFVFLNVYSNYYKLYCSGFVEPVQLYCTGFKNFLNFIFNFPNHQLIIERNYSHSFIFNFWIILWSFREVIQLLISRSYSIINF